MRTKVFTPTEKHTAEQLHKRYSSFVDECVGESKFDELLNKSQFAGSNKDVLMKTMVFHLLDNKLVDYVHEDNSHKQVSVHDCASGRVLCIPSHPSFEEFEELYDELMAEK